MSKYKNLSEEVRKIAEQSQQVVQIMEEIKRKQEKYRGSVVVYSLQNNMKQVGIVQSADFQRNIFYVRIDHSDRLQQLDMTRARYTIIDKEELYKEL